MIITKEQEDNQYPLKEVKFMDTYDEYLSEEKDSYGLKKRKPDSFAPFSRCGDEVPAHLEREYDESVKKIHAYLDKGYEL